MDRKKIVDKLENRFIMAVFGVVWLYIYILYTKIEDYKLKDED